MIPVCVSLLYQWFQLLLFDLYVHRVKQGADLGLAHALGLAPLRHARRQVEVVAHDAARLWQDAFALLAQQDAVAEDARPAQLLRLAGRYQVDRAAEVVGGDAERQVFLLSIRWDWLTCTASLE